MQDFLMAEKISRQMDSNLWDNVRTSAVSTTKIARLKGDAKKKKEKRRERKMIK